MIIDAHAHIYPDKIAKRASQSIGDFYDVEGIEEGTVARLLRMGESSGIDRFLVHSVATSPEQVGVITDYIAGVVQSDRERFIGFTSLHPACGDHACEIERAIGLGIRGVKLHPDFQRFDIDSPEAFRMYEVLEGRLPVLIHTGDYRTQFSKPERLLRVRERFPRLVIVAAHFGGWSEWEHAAEVLAGAGVFVDTSSSQAWLSPEQVRGYLDRYGEDWCIFGSDYPMWDAGAELERLLPLFRSEREREKVLHENIERVIGER